MAGEGVMVVLYDLPMENKDQRQEYVKFRKTLKKMAYRQLQESVYIKHLKRIRCQMEEVDRLEKNAPEEGSLIVFSMTMQQFREMVVLRGEGVPFENQFHSVVNI